jgi:predicted RNA-binding Zn-ribbon protein involved in translation (DUF1610 family)
MSLILDHINGVANDNRLENLRIVCPNCNATLDTHCGRRTRAEKMPRLCLSCGREFTPNYATHRYCSPACGARHNALRRPRPERRKVEWPTHEQLLEDVAAMSMRAVGRKYGVSDTAVRKWLRWYAARAEGGDAEAAA